MPNAKAIAGSTPPGPVLPRPARPVAGHRGDLERLGPPAIRGAIPGPDRVGRRLRDPRHPRPWPRSSNRYAATVPTGASCCEHHDVLARDFRPECRRVAAGRARARDPPARARGAARDPPAWWPSAPPRRPRSEATRARGDATADSEYHEDPPHPPGEDRDTSIARPARPTSSAGGRSSKRPCAARPRRSRSSPPPAVGSPWSSTSSARRPATTWAGPAARPPPASTPASSRRPRNTPRR